MTMSENESTKNEPDMKSEMPEPEDEGSGAYGVEQILASEEELENVRKHSSYHFPQDKLDHKTDRVDKEDK